MPDDDRIPRSDPASPHYLPGDTCANCGEDCGPHWDAAEHGGLCEACFEESLRIDRDDCFCKVHNEIGATEQELYQRCQLVTPCEGACNFRRTNHG